MGWIYTYIYIYRSVYACVYVYVYAYINVCTHTHALFTSCAGNPVYSTPSIVFNSGSSCSCCLISFPVNPSSFFGFTRGRLETQAISSRVPPNPTGLKLVDRRLKTSRKVLPESSIHDGPAWNSRAPKPPGVKRLEFQAGPRKTVWFLVRNGGMDYGDYYWGII